MKEIKYYDKILRQCRDIKRNQIDLIDVIDYIDNTSNRKGMLKKIKEFFENNPIADKRDFKLKSQIYIEKMNEVKHNQELIAKTEGDKLSKMYEKRLNDNKKMVSSLEREIKKLQSKIDRCDNAIAENIKNHKDAITNMTETNNIIECGSGMFQTYVDEIYKVLDKM